MDQGDYLTLEELETCTTHEVELPALSKAAGRSVKLKFRRIGRPEYYALVPLPPAESLDWKLEEFDAKRAAWMLGLPAEEQIKRRQLDVDFRLRVIALAALQPELTVETARRLGGDADVAFAEIVRVSEIMPAPEPEAAPQQASPDAP
jgi:hypothetical protein